MYCSKSHKLQVAVLSVPDVPHPDCLEDPHLPNLILAASISNVSTAFRYPMMMRYVNIKYWWSLSTHTKAMICDLPRLFITTLPFVLFRLLFQGKRDSITWGIFGGSFDNIFDPKSKAHQSLSCYSWSKVRAGTYTSATLAHGTTKYFKILVPWGILSGPSIVLQLYNKRKNQIKYTAAMSIPPQIGIEAVYLIFSFYLLFRLFLACTKDVKYW